MELFFGKKLNWWKALISFNESNTQIIANHIKTWNTIISTWTKTPKQFAY